jgi:hypothetical protein
VNRKCQNVVEKMSAGGWEGKNKQRERGGLEEEGKEQIN